MAYRCINEHKKLIVVLLLIIEHLAGAIDERKHDQNLSIPFQFGDSDLKVSFLALADTWLLGVKLCKDKLIVLLELFNVVKTKFTILSDAFNMRSSSLRFAKQLQDFRI